MSTMMMEFNTVPVAHPARPPLSGCSASFTSLATLNESAKPTLLPHSIDPIAHTNQTFNERHTAILTFGKREAAELEFSSQSHLIILLPDGIAGGCEWSNGSQTGKLPSVASNTVLFNPARDYLWIRKRVSQPYCRMLLLTIDPTLVNRLDVGDVNVAELQFRQKIDIEDQGVRLTVAAI